MPGAGDRWVVMVHGKGADRDETLPSMSTMVDLGYPVLSIRYRNDPNQPQDPSGYYRYGTTEWMDLEAAVQYAVDRGAADVILAGFSTGASVAVSFMVESQLSNEVAAVVFDAPNLDLSAAVDAGASERSLPGIGLPIPGTLVGSAKFIGELRYGFDFDDYDYIARTAELEIPMLIFHGTKDDTVPIAVSRELVTLRPSTMLVEAAGAGHVRSWSVGPARALRSTSPDRSWCGGVRFGFVADVLLR